MKSYTKMLRFVDPVFITSGIYIEGNYVIFFFFPTRGKFRGSGCQPKPYEDALLQCLTCK